VRPNLRWLGSALPMVFGVTGLVCFASLWGGRPYIPIALFFLILGFANISNSKSRLLSAFVVLGDASYSLYLLHPIVFRVTLGLTTWVSKTALWSEELIRYGSIAAAVAISIASWRYFERPIIALG